MTTAKAAAASTATVQFYA